MSWKKRGQELLGRAAKPFLHIYPGEGSRVLLMFLYFFLTITVLYILKPVQRSLFITSYGADKLSWAYMGEGPFLILVTFLYMKFAKRVNKSVFYKSMLLFFPSSLVIFWLAARLHTSYVPGLFYLWHAALSITMTTVFWTLANDLFTTHEAKRLFGCILAGGSLGGIAGGMVAQGLVRWISTEDLIGVAAIILSSCFFLVHKLCELYCHSPQNLAATEPEGATSQEDPKSALGYFLKSPYLILLCIIVMMAKMAGAITDNQLSVVAAQTIHGKENLTAFFGGFFASLNTLSFLMQFFVTSLILRYLGVSISLYLLPIGLALFGVMNFSAPTLMAAIMLRMFEGGTTVSVQQATKEVLYLPISSKTRRRIKPLIDMLGYRMAKSLGGVWIAAGLPLLHLAPNRVAILLVFLVPFWIFAVRYLLKIYQTLIHQPEQKI